MPIYLTFHGKAICEPGAGRWLDSKTFVFNESVVANEEGLRQLEFILTNLGIELIVCHSPGWYDSIGNGNIGTSHMDMVMLTVDHRKVLLAPHLVNYGFVRELLRRDYTIIEVPVEEYWDLALNGVTLSPGKVIMNAGSPTVVEGTRTQRRRGDPGRLLRKPPLRDRRPPLRHPRTPTRPGLTDSTVARVARGHRLVCDAYHRRLSGSSQGRELRWVTRGPS